MHNEGKVCLGFRCQYTCRREAGIIDERSIIITSPVNGVWRIRDDGFKGFIIPMSGFGQRIAMGNIKFVVADIMKEHIDTAEVVGGDIDFLAKESLTDIFLADEFSRF